MAVVLWKGYSKESYETVIIKRYFEYFDHVVPAALGKIGHVSVELIGGDREMEEVRYKLKKVWNFGSKGSFNGLDFSFMPAVFNSQIDKYVKLGFKLVDEIVE